MDAKEQRDSTMKAIPKYRLVDGTDDVLACSDGYVYVVHFNKLRKYSNQINNHGYARINLILHGEKRSVLVHRVIASAFLPNPQNLPQINHLDGDKTNNTPSNLEWCTARANIQHAYRAGLIKNSGRPKKIQL